MAVITPANLRAALVAFIRTVDPVGQIHDRRKVIRTEPDVKRILARSTDGVVNAWMISPAQTNPVRSTVMPGYIGHGVKGGGNVLTSFRFQIEGIYGLDDANSSETVFFDLAWALVDEFNAYGSIPEPGGGSIVGLHQQEPADMPQFGYVMYANTFLCHYCRIEVGFIGRTRPA